MRKYLEPVTKLNDERGIVWQELLARPGSHILSLSEQEFYELSIEESEDVFRSGLIVKQSHAQWIEIDQQVMWEEPVWERWPTLKKAKERCEEWKRALAAKGFTVSNMDS